LYFPNHERKLHKKFIGFGQVVSEKFVKAL